MQLPKKNEGGDEKNLGWRANHTINTTVKSQKKYESLLKQEYFNLNDIYSGSANKPKQNVLGVESSSIKNKSINSSSSIDIEKLRRQINNDNKQNIIVDQSSNGQKLRTGRSESELMSIADGTEIEKRFQRNFGFIRENNIENRE